jgi:23S rRNA (pseudouridine1915-N3)-methyltransferase
LLSIEWEEFSTNEFLDFIDKKEALFGEVVFIIWWAYGINLNLIEKYINLKLSFSKMTFPHSQAIMMLLEQIYRITSIKKWGNYHH